MDPSELNLNLSRKTLPEQFALQIEELIQNSSLSPGSRLPGERELAQQYNLSRSVVREGLGILQARGLVHSKPGKGTFITHLERTDSVEAISRCLRFSDPPVSDENLAELRLAVEPAAAGAAAQNAGKKEIGNLTSILDILRNPSTPDADFIKSDLEFHLAVGRASGNPLFAIMVESITGILYDFMEEVFRNNLPDIRQRVIERHSAILNAIEAHDSAEASNSMRDHITTAVQ